MNEGNRAGRSVICRYVNECRVNEGKYVDMLWPRETCENKREVRELKKKKKDEYSKLKKVSQRTTWPSGTCAYKYINLYLSEKLAALFQKLYELI